MAANNRGADKNAAMCSLTCTCIFVVHKCSKKVFSKCGSYTLYQRSFIHEMAENYPPGHPTISGKPSLTKCPKCKVIAMK